MHSNFTKYKPEDLYLKELHDKHGITFMRDDQGEDWYEIQKKLNKDKVTVFCSSGGEVITASTDPTTIPPIEGGFCFQVDEFNFDFTKNIIKYDKNLKEFILTPVKKSLNALLKDLKILEIKKDLGDTSVDSLILDTKRLILETTLE